MARTKASTSDIEAIKRDIKLPGESPYVKVCAYGRNGSGKTRLLGTAPKVLRISFPEEEERSIKGISGMRTIEAETWVKLGNIYWYLKSGKHPFKSVGIDTITAMNGTALDFVMGQAEERDPTRERAQPDKRTWGRAGQLMRGMIMAYVNLPMHVILLAQERRIRDQDTEELLEVTVDLPNSSRGISMGSVGVLGRMVPREVRVKGKKGRQWRDHLILAPHEVIQTKDQTNALGPVLSRPTIPKIIEAWVGDTETDE